MTSFLNIYPWFFFFLIILGQGAQAIKIHKTKKTDDLSLQTFILSLLSSMLFGITCFLGGEYSYSLVIGNAGSVLILAYTLFMIWKNNGFKYRTITTIIILLIGSATIILGTINFIGFVVNDTAIINIDNIPSWVMVLIPTLGGIFSALIFTPQLIKTIKTKATKDLHYFFMIFFWIYLLNVVIFWLIFGIDSGKWDLSVPTIAFTTTGMVVQAIVIYLKYKYEKK